MSPEDRIRNLVLPQLEKVRRRGEGQWEACCPAHADSNPSFGVAVGRDGRILLHCYAGCSKDEILGALGLSMSILFDKPQADRMRPFWYADDRRQQEQRDRETFPDRVVLAQCREAREKGRPLTKQDEAREREAWLRVKGSQ